MNRTESDLGSQVCADRLSNLVSFSTLSKNKRERLIDNFDNPAAELLCYVLLATADKLVLYCHVSEL